MPALSKYVNIEGVLERLNQIKSQLDGLSAEAAKEQASKTEAVISNAYTKLKSVYPDIKRALQNPKDKHVVNFVWATALGYCAGHVLSSKHNFSRSNLETIMWHVQSETGLDFSPLVARVDQLFELQTVTANSDRVREVSHERKDVGLLVEIAQKSFDEYRSFAENPQVYMRKAYEGLPQEFKGLFEVARKEDFNGVLNSKLPEEMKLGVIDSTYILMQIYHRFENSEMLRRKIQQFYRGEKPEGVRLIDNQIPVTLLVDLSKRFEIPFVQSFLYFNLWEAHLESHRRREVGKPAKRTEVAELIRNLYSRYKTPAELTGAIMLGYEELLKAD